MTADSIEKRKQVKKRNVHIVSYEEPESGEMCDVVPLVFLSCVKRLESSANYTDTDKEELYQAS